MPPQFLETYVKFRKVLRRIHPKTTRRNVSRSVGVLLEIKLRPDATVEELAATVRLCKSGVVALLEDLTNQGLIRQEKVTKDRRRKVQAIILPKGEELLAKIIAPLLS